MKQVVQSYKTGIIELSDVPAPLCKSGGVLVRNVNSLISIGTEKSMIDIARKNLLAKAQARPDLVKRFIDKAKKEGLLNVYKEAMNRLDEPVALGYSSSGLVLDVGQGVVEFAKGDRVACSGAGFEQAADIIWVPENLCVKLPENVSFDEGAFVMLGGIAMQGIRLAELTFGENVAVIGLGLLGMLTVQMLSAYGCKVIGIDIDGQKAALAKEFGASAGFVPGLDDIKVGVENLTKGFGVGAVIITASSKDNAPLQIAEDICRKKGKIILVGVADIQLTRKNFWDKELSFSVSKAAGPGSIEPIYEQRNYDYPLEYVRWTEKRNLEEFIALLSAKKVRLERLITHRFDIIDALKAYEMITDGKERCVGVLLEYAGKETAVDPAAGKVVLVNSRLKDSGGAILGLIGGGMFTKNILLPALKSVKNIVLKGVATTTGITSSHIARKYGFAYCTTDYQDILKDEKINNIIITTRHNLHSRMVIEGLKAGKNVFVEKPLCVNEQELAQISGIFKSAVASGGKLMVGFNRRYSRIAREAKKLFGPRTKPLVMSYRINAGYIPADHWTQDAAVGGDRIIGEVCHFIDFLQFLTDSYPVSVFANSISGDTGKYLKSDNMCLQIKFTDGSIATIVYAACGSKVFSRERVEVFGEESAMVIDDFKTALLIKAGRQKTIKKLSQDMGYFDELDYFFNSREFTARELFKSYIYTTLATFKAIESLEQGVPIKIEPNNMQEIFV